MHKVQVLLFLLSNILIILYSRPEMRHPRNTQRLIFSLLIFLLSSTQKMQKIQVLVCLVSITSIILFILQDSVGCSPMYFRAYREKQQKLREKRLKKSAAEKRLKELEDRYRLRIQSRRNADDNRMTPFHTTRTKWIKTDMLHTRVEANMRRHRLASNLLSKEVPEIGDVLNHRANQLQAKSKEINEQKNEVKSQGFNNFDDNKIFFKSFDKEMKVHDKFYKKTEKCRRIIDKNEKYIDTHSQNSCSIMK
jgi:signal transduction histidine kinase